MNYFLAVNNPNKYDYKLLLRDGHEIDHWAARKLSGSQPTAGDVVFHYVTTAGGAETGIHFRMVCTGTDYGVIPVQYWKPGEHPADPIRFINLTGARKSRKKPALDVKSISHSLGMEHPAKGLQVDLIQLCHSMAEEIEKHF